MRMLAAPIALVATLAASMPQASAGKCYVDSDCPTGMTCNSDGGCEVPSGGNGGGGTSSGGHRSNGVVLVYGLILVVVVVAILVPAMRATDQANGVRAKRDQAFPPICPADRTPDVTGLTLRF